MQDSFPLVQGSPLCPDTSPLSQSLNKKPSLLLGPHWPLPALQLHAPISVTPGGGQAWLPRLQALCEQTVTT